MSVLSKPYFHDEAKAFEYLEGILWPEGPVCPHCGTLNLKHYDLGKTRLGLRKCAEKACRKQFTVKVGTVFEQAHIPLNKMLQAVYLMCSSKKGISAHQLHRVLEITYKSAWFLAHRIREAMRDGKLERLGGEGKTIEADETYFGNSGKAKWNYLLTPDGWKKIGGGEAKFKVMSLVERGGSVRSVQVDYLTANAAAQFLWKNADARSVLNTDESNIYRKVGRSFVKHETVNHSQNEYGRGSAYTNTIEGYFSIFKRGMKGVYQHCSEKHLHRYLSEFDFRYNNRAKLGFDDKARAWVALTGISGKRLKYRPQICS
jgi:transposase-like protein